MVKIIQKENDVLRQIAKPVSITKITESGIRKTIADMKTALDKQDDGVAIAAPQIGVSLRIFVVSEKVFQIQNDNAAKKEMKKSAQNLVFINPKIIKLSKKKSDMTEGCLSVRWLYGITKRSQNVTVEAYDEYGKKFTRGAGGLLAQIFQHEIDHLDGILFIDHAREIEEILPVAPKS